MSQQGGASNLEELVIDPPETRIGLLIPTRQSLLEPEVSVRSMVELAVVAEELGFDSVWVGESILGRPRPEIFSLLGALSWATTKITIGTATLLPALRNPLLTAQALATVDCLTGGRLVVGVGAGFANHQTRAETEALGVDYGQRFSLMIEAVRCWRTLWAGEPCTSRTEAWHFVDVELDPAPAQSGGPPVWLGGASEATQERAGRHFDGWMPTSNSPASFESGLARVRAAASSAKRNEESVSAAIVTTVALADGPECWWKLEAYLQRYYGVNLPLERILEVVGGVAGSVEECARWISSFVESGAEHLIVRLAAPNPLEETRRHGARLLERLRESSRDSLIRRAGRLSP